MASSVILLKPVMMLILAGSPSLEISASHTSRSCSLTVNNAQQVLMPCTDLDGFLNEDLRQFPDLRGSKRRVLKTPMSFNLTIAHE